MKVYNILYSLLGILVIVLYIPFAQADNDHDDLTYSANITITNNTARQPNINYPTEIIAHTGIGLPLSASAQRGRISWEISPDNSTWTRVAQHRHGSDIGGVLETFSSQNDETVSFIVPKAQFYRVLLIVEAGTPDLTVNSLYEIEYDVFEGDPFQMECPDFTQINQAVSCSGTSRYFNGTVRTDINFNYEVQNSSGSVINSGSTTRIASFWTLSFTPNSSGSYFITMYNNTYGWNDTDVVSAQTITATATFNDTNIIENITAFRTNNTLEHQNTRSNTTTEIQNKNFTVGVVNLNSSSINEIDDNTQDAITQAEGNKMAIGIWFIVFLGAIAMLVIGIVRSREINVIPILWFTFAVGLSSVAMWYGFALPLESSGVTGPGNWVAGGMGMLAMFTSLLFLIKATYEGINLWFKKNRSI